MKSYEQEDDPLRSQVRNDFYSQNSGYILRKVFLKVTDLFSEQTNKGSLISDSLHCSAINNGDKEYISGLSNEAVVIRQSGRFFAFGVQAPTCSGGISAYESINRPIRGDVNVRLYVTR